MNYKGQGVMNMSSEKDYKRLKKSLAKSEIGREDAMPILPFGIPEGSGYKYSSFAITKEFMESLEKAQMRRDAELEKMQETMRLKRSGRELPIHTLKKEPLKLKLATLRSTVYPRVSTIIRSSIRRGLATIRNQRNLHKFNRMKAWVGRKTKTARLHCSVAGGALSLRAKMAKNSIGQAVKKVMGK